LLGFIPSDVSLADELEWRAATAEGEEIVDKLERAGFS
jgi:hypothetical protein